MTKRAAVVTGATSGLGEAAAVALAATGLRVILAGRDADRGEAVVTGIRAAGGDASFLRADLFTMAGVKRFAADVRRSTPELALLINNAGGTFGKVELTVDGLERTVALNVVAPFLATEGLAGELQSGGGRVVNLVTGLPKGATTTMEQLFGEGASAGLGQYTRAKLALLALTGEQQRRYERRGITVVSLHPGIIPGTRFGQDMPAFLRAFGGFVARLFGFATSLEDAAQRYVRIGTGEVTPGGFYDQGKLAPGPNAALDGRLGAEVWDRLQSLERTGGPARAGALAPA